MCVCAAGWSSSGQGLAVPHRLPLVPHQLACEGQAGSPRAGSNAADIGDSESAPLISSGDEFFQVNELFDYWGGSMFWRLTPSEVRRVLHLRSDTEPLRWLCAVVIHCRTEFKTEDVERIKLQ